ncbi:hypothetical protein Tco_0394483 [Tanacetum coccineum]
MIKSSSGDTPFSLTYGTKAVIPAEIGMPTLRTAKVDIVQNDEALKINLDLLKEKRDQASIREAKSKAKMEKYYNSKVRNTSFKPEDLVYRNNDVSHAKDSGNLAQNGKDRTRIVDSIDLNGATRNTTHLRLFCISLRDQAINWLDRLSAGSISTWDDLTTFQIFYNHVDYTTQMAISYAAGRRLRKLRPEEAWETIEDLAKYEEEEWNEPIFFEKGSPDYVDANLEQELESMEH